MDCIRDKSARKAIRRRLTQMPPTRAMVRELLRVIKELRQENAALKRQGL